MDVRDLFFVIGSIALILLSALVIFFFYSLYRLVKIAKTGIKIFSATSKEIQSSLGSLSRTWLKTSIVGVAVNIIRHFIRRRA